MQEKDYNIFLKSIVEKVLAQLEAEKKLRENSSSIYIVINSKWDNKYYLLIDELKALTEESINILFFDDEDCECVNRFREVYNSEKFYKALTAEIKAEDKVIFPVVSRDEVIQTVNCYSNTNTTKLIRKSFEAGANVYFLKYGIEKLSGREPEGYKKKILNYYKELLELGIEIRENIKVVV